MVAHLARNPAPHGCESVTSASNWVGVPSGPINQPKGTTSRHSGPTTLSFQRQHRVTLSHCLAAVSCVSASALCTLHCWRVMCCRCAWGGVPELPGGRERLARREVVVIGLASGVRSERAADQALR
ncbi:unnamed protein product [Protopolystoma xenopodis]|uniref:Uncharacterized protein n=1 Tax=Protopolystoma xenopodis TaxID=117903 RepID=A0A3S5CS56_9PLAT|nr:unnamed protein product [Protopolystoma xenopodis]